MEKPAVLVVDDDGDVRQAARLATKRSRPDAQKKCVAGLESLSVKVPNQKFALLAAVFLDRVETHAAKRRVAASYYDDQ